MVRLDVVDGVMLGESFLLADTSATIGRADDSDVVIRDEKISRHHCRIRTENARVVIEDLGSSNGTYVNDEAVTRTQLSDGDTIKLGRHVLAFSFSGRTGVNDSVLIVPEEPGIHNTTIELILPNDSGEFVMENLASTQDPDRMLRDLGILYRAGNLINDIGNRDELFKTVLDMTFDAVNAGEGFLVLAETPEKLVVKADRSETRRSGRTLAISRAVAAVVLEQGHGVLINDCLNDRRFGRRDSVVSSRLRSVLCAPLKSKDRVLGLIYLDNPSVADAFSSDDLRLVSAIGMQAGAAIENSRLFAANENLMFGSISALVATVEAKDRYIKGHSERVARISRALADEMGLPAEKTKVIHMAALLHDIGKIGTAESILHKEGPLDPDEMAVIKEHPARGAAILANIQDMADVVTAVRHHHESFDGSGYPDGIKAEDIPLLSRIITVADSYDAMTSDRPYRRRLTQEASLAEILRCRGTQFDPVAVDAILASACKSRMIGGLAPLH